MISCFNILVSALLDITYNFNFFLVSFSFFSSFF